VRIFLWNVHDAWTTAFVQGRHEYFVPSALHTFGRCADRPTVHVVGAEEAARLPIDAVVLQRPEEVDRLAEEWLGRRPGVDVPAVYVEHDAPQGHVNEMRHPAADRRDLVLVHVTHFNRLFWDVGSTPTSVIEHGIVDPGYRYTGEIPAAAVVIDEPGRRRRVSGTDLLASLAQTIPIEVFGFDAARAGGLGSVAQDELRSEVACRRVYLHPVRWTSIGIALLEAMHLGMPIVALATTEVPAAVPATAGVVSNRLDVVERALRRFVDDPVAARRAGIAARTAALARFGLRRFLLEWDHLLQALPDASRWHRTARPPTPARRRTGSDHASVTSQGAAIPSRASREATVRRVRDQFRSGGG
jgi:hypothetical protein